MTSSKASDPCHKGLEDFRGHTSFSSILLLEPISIPIVRLMRYFTLGIAPNVITLLSLFPIMAAAYSFSQGRLIQGAVSFFLFALLDDIDGMWARAIGRTSKLGSKLDRIIAMCGNPAMFFGLWYSQFYLKGNGVFGACIIVVRYLTIICAVVMGVRLHYKTILSRVDSYYSPDDERFGIFFLAPLLNLVEVLLPMFVLLTLTSFTVQFFKQKVLSDIRQRVRGNVDKLQISAR